MLHFSMWPGKIGRLHLDEIATDYRMVYWLNRWPSATSDELGEELCAAAARIRPTMVFMQIQTGGVLQPHHVQRLRRVCDPSVVIINWDGDQHFEAASPQRQWFVELGRVCDASLVVNTEHPDIYASLGVRHPGFFEIAVENSVFFPRPAWPRVPPIALLANHLYGATVHARRCEYVRQLVKRCGPELFAVYGAGWGDCPCGRRSLELHEESSVYAAASASLSISARNDLPRYTSDRLFRLLASGGVPVVERFPDCEGLGLVDGKNCLLWSGWGGLCDCLSRAGRMTPEQTRQMRDAAVSLGSDHTWQSRLPELLALLDAVRSARSGI